MNDSSDVIDGPAVARKPRIDFIVEGGSRTGLGHVMRSGALAQYARTRGFPVGVLMNDDPASRASWKRLVPSVDPEDHASWPPESAADVYVLDLPASDRIAKENWVSRIRSTDAAVVLLDDEHFVDRADLTILPALHHAPRTRLVRAPNPGSLLSGPRYSILSDAHADSSPVPWADRRRCLISLGGADPWGATPRVARLLREILDSSDRFDCITGIDLVLGPAYRDSERDPAHELGRLGCTLHHALSPKGMARLMAASRFALVGFGTTLTELALAGTPFASLTHHPSDDVFARRLEEKGIGVHLGCARSIDNAAIRVRLTRALDDMRWQQRSAAHGRAAVDHGRGRERILMRIVERVSSRSGSHTRPSEVPKDQAMLGEGESFRFRSTA